MSHRLVGPVAVLGIVVALLACGQPAATPAPVALRASGSSSMCRLMQEWRAAFAEEAPTIGLEIECLGSEFGLEALRAGRADLAFVSWQGTGETRWRTTAVARDGLAVIVHASNPVEGLGILQLRGLFAGQIYEWTALDWEGSKGPVQLVSREEGSGSRAAFESLVMDGLPVSSLAVVAGSAQAVVDYVAQNPAAIGYVAMGELTVDVRCLAIEGTLPTPDSARSGSYPLSHALWIASAEPPSEPVNAFVEFALGAVGQQIADRSYGRIR